MRTLASASFRSRAIAARVVATLIATSMLGGCGAGGTSGPPEARMDRSPLLPEEPTDLPELDFEGFRALLEELRGKPVVVNFWGSWCPPCRLEAPDLAAVSREFDGRVHFVGVNILDSRPAAREFIADAGWPYPSVFDPAGEIRDRLGYVGQPVTVVYDPAGEVVFEWAGVVTADLLEEQVSKALGR